MCVSVEAADSNIVLSALTCADEKAFWTLVLGSCFKCHTKGLQLKHYLLGGANDQIPSVVPGTQGLTQHAREGVRSQVPVAHREPPRSLQSTYHELSRSFSAEMAGLLSPATTPACLPPCPR